VNAGDVEGFERCIRDGGVAVFPADTVYGLACDPESEEAVDRLYALKGRPRGKPSAVMFFGLERLLDALSGIEAPTAAALHRLLPGPITALLANPERRYPLACGEEPGTLGVRVPALEGALAPLGAATCAVLQSSANLAGEPDARRVADIPATVRAGAGFTLDGGALPGTPSTVIDLRDYAVSGRWEVVREGAMSRGEIASRL
jgi:L-threonylcarbamoyladenylate synthase